MANLDFGNLGQEGWLDVLPGFQRTAIAELLAAGKTEEEVAELWLSRTGPEVTAGFGTAGNISSYFKNFRTEMDAFICGDTRYATERAQAALIWQQGGRNGLVPLVAGVIATKVGLAAVALIPVVALIFALVAKIGVGAYCKSHNPS
jgi:hypothetical protein